VEQIASTILFRLMALLGLALIFVLWSLWFASYKLICWIGSLPTHMQIPLQDVGYCV